MAFKYFAISYFILSQGSQQNADDQNSAAGEINVPRRIVIDIIS